MRVVKRLLKSEIFTAKYTLPVIPVGYGNPVAWMRIFGLAYYYIYITGLLA